MERVQAENEQLKKAPGVVSSEQLAMLKRDNDGLKVRLERKSWCKLEIAVEIMNK